MNGHLAVSHSMSVCHPNEVDRKRIIRALAKRRRYRYVTPEVLLVEAGYHIVSPCCSRNIDPEGGVIDIARLEFRTARGVGSSTARQDAGSSTASSALAQILELLNEDPDRQFWQ